MGRAAAVTQRPLPDVVSFATGWIRQGQRTSTGEPIQAGPPLTSRRRRLSGKKTEAPDTHAKNFSRGSPGALFIEWAERPQSHKDSSRMSCLSLLDGQDKDKGHTRRADSGRRQRSPIGAGDCPERKQKRRIPTPKTFPGEAPELDSLTIKPGRSWKKDKAKGLPFPAPVR